MPCTIVDAGDCNLVIPAVSTNPEIDRHHDVGFSGLQIKLH